MLYKHILAPIDYSVCSRTALAFALRIAGEVGASVDIVHVWDRPSYVSDSIVVHGQGHPRSLIELIQENAENEMRQFLSDVVFPPNVSVTSRLLSGEPVSTLLGELKK